MEHAVEPDARILVRIDQREVGKDGFEARLDIPVAALLRAGQAAGIAPERWDMADDLVA